MHRAFTRRITHLWHGFVVPIWTWVIAGLFGLLGALTWIRDELLPERWKARLRLAQFLPRWQGYVWTTIGLLILFTIFFEGSFQASERAAEKSNDGVQNDELLRAQIEAQIDHTQELREQRFERQAERHRQFARRLKGLSDDEPML